MVLSINLLFSTVDDEGLLFVEKMKVYIRILVCNILFSNVTLCHAHFVSSLLVSLVVLFTILPFDIFSNNN